MIFQILHLTFDFCHWYRGTFAGIEYTGIGTDGTGTASATVTKGTCSPSTDTTDIVEILPHFTDGF